MERPAVKCERTVRSNRIILCPQVKGKTGPKVPVRVGLNLTKLKGGKLRPALKSLSAP